MSYKCISLDEAQHLLDSPQTIIDDIREKQFLATKRIIIKFLKKYPNIKSKKQKGKSTFFKKLRNLDDKLSLNKG